MKVYRRSFTLPGIFNVPFAEAVVVDDVIPFMQNNIPIFRKNRNANIVSSFVNSSSPIWPGIWKVDGKYIWLRD